MKVDRVATLVCVGKVLGKCSMLDGFGLMRCDLRASEGSLGVWASGDGMGGASFGVIGSRS